MTVQIHDYTDEPDTDEYEASLSVCTVDGAGRERWYDMRLRDDPAFEKLMVAGKKVDRYGDRIGSPSQMVWDVAREHFREHGYDVKE